MGLLESLADDEANLKIQTGKDTDDGEESKATGDDTGYEPDRKSARGRISARRSARNAKASPRSEGEVSQEDGGASRRALGDSSGSSESASGDGSSSSRDEGTSQGDGNLEDAPKDDAGWAKYRREQRELKAQLKEANEKLAKAVAQPVKAETTQAEVKAVVKQRTLDELGAEPDREKDLAGWLVYNAEKQNIIMEELRAANTKATETSESDRRANMVSNAAIQDIESYKQRQPDFQAAFDHMKTQYSNAVRLLKPGITQQELTNLIATEIYNRAQECIKTGAHLGEVLYDTAIEQFGYRRGAARTVESTRQGTGNKPNLKVVSQNQRRSASSLEGGGSSGANRITIEQAAEMSPEELLSLSPEDSAYLASLGV